jgi:chromosome segregation ATPase
MYLKSLELSGFKSFANRATLHFTSPITAIVGPNGSGKSNTAEAFQFVLGEQSIKSMRGKRGEDMIWNGGGDSPSGGRANRAYVKLIFDNSRRIFSTIDFDEVTIERVVHRDNVNEYLLNSSQVRLKDIVEILISAHIGVTGHHIISQGEADHILTASIRERRLMIEDALGLKTYQWKKLESIRKLEKTEENMKQVESLRREIAPHLKFLKKQAEKVEKTEGMKKELIGLYKEYFYYEDFYIKKEKDRLKLELVTPERELTELNHSLEKAKGILTDSKNKDAKSDAVIVVEKRLAAIRAEKDSIMRELGKIEGEISARKKSVEKENEKIKKDEFKTVYLKDVEGVVSSIESFNDMSDARRLFSEIIRTLKDFIAKHRFSTDSAFIAEAENEINELSREKERFELKLESANDEESKLNCEYSEIKEAIEKEKDTNRDAEKDVFKIIARQNELRSIISSLLGQLNIVTKDEESFKRELGEAGIIGTREATNFSSYIQEQSMGGEVGETVPDRANQQDLLKKIEKIKVRLEDAGGVGGGEVMKEYKETEERDTFLGHELLDLEKAKGELLNLIADLDVRIDFEFKNGILRINNEFQKYFSLMFGGGKAELSVVKEKKKRKKSDIEELDNSLQGNDIPNEQTEDNGIDEDEDGPEGLEVNVNLPRKKVKGLMMLSGGERALTSIALLFAISQVNPPPFIILDETDAALDEANSRKYGDMIEDLSKHSQLILITHNRETMSRAGVLYGITMGADGASRLVSIAFDEAIKVAK